MLRVIYFFFWWGLRFSFFFRHNIFMNIKFLMLRRYGYLYLLMSKRYLLSSKYNIRQSFGLCIQCRVTLNNFFLIGHDGAKLIELITCGLTGFRGPARKSVHTIRLAVKLFVFRLRRRGIRRGYLYIRGPVNRRLVNAFRLMRRLGFFFTFVLFFPGVAHNGPRGAKLKRR